MPAPASLSDRISPRASGSGSGTTRRLSASGVGGHANGYSHQATSAVAGPSTSKLPPHSSSSRFPNPLGDEDEDDEEEEGAIREETHHKHQHKRPSANGTSLLNGTTPLPPSLPMKPPPPDSTNGKHRQRERDYKPRNSRDHDPRDSRNSRDHDPRHSRNSSRSVSPHISRTKPLGARYSELPRPPPSRKRTRSPSPLHRSSSLRTRYRSPDPDDEYDSYRRRDHHHHRSRYNDRSPSPAYSTASSSRKPLPHWKQRDEPVSSDRPRWKERDREPERDRHRDRDRERGHDRDHRRARSRSRDTSPPYRSSRHRDSYYDADSYRPDRYRDRERERDRPTDDARTRRDREQSDRPDTERYHDRSRSHRYRHDDDDDDRGWERKRDTHRISDRHRDDQHSSNGSSREPAPRRSRPDDGQEDDEDAHISRHDVSRPRSTLSAAAPAPASTSTQPAANGKSRWAKIATSTPTEVAASTTTVPAATSWQTAPPTGPKSLLVPPSGPRATAAATAAPPSAPASSVPTGPRASRILANTGTHTPNGSIPSGPRALAYHRPAAPAVVAASSSPTTPRTPDSTTASAATTATTATTLSAATDKGAADQDVEMALEPVHPHSPAPPPPPPPPAQLSFGHTLLPNELPPDKRGTTWRVTYDPQLQKDKAQVALKGKDVVREHPDISAPAPTDPRLSSAARTTGIIAPSSTFIHVCKAAKRRARPQLDVPTWKWTKDSTAPRPPPPPRAIVITGLSPLMTTVQLRTQLRAFGRIEEQELKMDPRTGQSLGIFWLRFAHDFEVKEDEEGDGKLVLGAAAPGQRGHECALRAVSEMQGRKIGAGTHDATAIHIELDGDKSHYVKAYRRELARRYAAESQTAKAAKVAAATAAAAASAAAAAAAAATATVSNKPPSSGTATPQQLHTSQAPTPTDRWQARQASSLGAASPSTPVVGSLEPAEPVSSIKARLASFGTPYMFIARPRQGAHTTLLTTAHIQRHLSSMCKPLAVMYRDDKSRVGWYVGFDARDAARRAKGFLERGPVLAGYRLDPELHDAPAMTTERRQILLDRREDVDGDGDDASRRRSPSPRRVSAKQQAQDALVERRITQGWTERELHEAARREILRQVNDVLLRDARNRSHGPFVSEFLKPDAKGGQLLQDSLRIVAEREEEAERAAAERRDRQRGDSGSATPTTPQHMRETADVDEDGDTSMDVARGQLPSFRKIKRRAPAESEVVDAKALAKKAAEAKALLVSSRKSSKGDVADMSDEEAVAAAVADGDVDVDAEMLDLASHTTKGGKKSLASKKASSSASTTSKSKSKSKLAAARHRPKIWSSDSSDGEESQHEESPAPVQATTTTTKQTKKARAGGAKGTTTKKGVQFALDEDGRATPASSSATPGPEDSVEAQLKAETAVLSKLKMGGGGRKGSGGAAAAASRARGVRSPSPDPYGLGLADDEEDLYYLRLALERLQAGEPVTPATVRPDEGEEEEEDEDEEADDDEEAPPRFRFTRAHESGCARTEGFYKIPPSQKAAHLPERNQATIDVASSANNVTLSSARDHRADSRRLVLGIEQHKKDTATDTDILKFNQLRSRKKQLKFAKSPIHDWGLYAMESIPAGDMVIEYVGEVVRQQVADHRERMYEKQGNFSTYLFRVDDDLVVDATHKGNIARLMNHCCVPNCTAKILTLNGQKRIVIFAKERIGRDQELTYDYKLGESGDIPCLCGVEGCRKWL